MTVNRLFTTVCTLCHGSESVYDTYIQRERAMTQATRTDLNRRLAVLMAKVEICLDRDRARALLTEATAIQTMLA